MAGSGRKALLEVWEWSGVSPKGLGVIGRPPGGQGVFERSSRRAGSGQETLPEGREWSRGPPKGPGVVGRYSRGHHGEPGVVGRSSG